MIDWLLWIVGFVLLIFSIIDLKVKAVPSIFLTGILFVVAFLNPSNLWFGVMGFIVAYLLMEADFFSGVADVKVMTLIAFMIGSVNWFLTFVVLIAVYGVAYKAIIKWRLAGKVDFEIAFLPVFFIIYILLVVLGGIQ